MEVSKSVSPVALLSRDLFNKATSSMTSNWANMSAISMGLSSWIHCWKGNMRHASEEHALTQKCHANENRFLMHEYIIACVVGVKWGRGRGRGNSSPRARRKISSRAGIPLSLFSFSLIFLPEKNIQFFNIFQKRKLQIKSGVNYIGGRIRGIFPMRKIKLKPWGLITWAHALT